MRHSQQAALGIDFGTESVRALVVDLQGRELAGSVCRYRHGQIVDTLPTSGKKLPIDYALQHPQDWIDSSIKAVRSAMNQAGIAAQTIVGIGVDFTSCTMLPCTLDGTPLCLLPPWQKKPLAWPKLWKHHGAKSQTQRMNELAAARHEPWLARYGGIIGLEWFFPKMLETLEQAPAVYHAADLFIEAGDWYVWQLIGAEACPSTMLPRSTCQAGYKALWNAGDGYPGCDYLGELHKDFADVVQTKMPGRLLAPGQSAGGLSSAMAKRMGLCAGTPVSAAIIDAHAGVPGAGGDADTLVMVMGTSSCYMLNSKTERQIPGVAGVVKDGILPGYFGYETGQAAVGDAFDWLRRMLGEKDFHALDAKMKKIPAGAQGVLCLDWMNGCRTPLMDGSLRGAFTGLSLATQPEHLYRALLEASGYGLRWIVELLRDGGVPVKRLVATGGLPHHNPTVVQIYADVLGESIVVHPSKQGPALGAAILGAMAAPSDITGFKQPTQAVRAMARGRVGQGRTFRPNRRLNQVYDQQYARYRQLAEQTAGR